MICLSLNLYSANIKIIIKDKNMKLTFKQLLLQILQFINDLLKHSHSKYVMRKICGLFEFIS